jgi:hypothetical protein
MRSVIIAAALFAGLSVTASAAPGTPSPSSIAQSFVEKAQFGSGYCRRLRRACEFKHERGEVGEGNCRRYRRECGRW